MASDSINVRQRYVLDGNEYNAPLEWEEATIIAEYDNDAVQPSLNIDNFTFCLEARAAILQWIATGRIYEGMPLDLSLYNINQSTTTFKSMIDFTLGYRDLPKDGRIEVGITKLDGLDNLFNKIGTITYGYLESIGQVRDSDYLSVDYMVEKKFNVVELLTTSIIIYLMVKEVQESIKRIADNIATISGIAASGISGSIGAAIYAVAVALLNVVYTAAIIIAIVDLANNLITAFLPIKRTHKVLNLKRALQIVCSYYGYSFETSFNELNNVAYLPSNQQTDTANKFGFIELAKGTNKGIPNPSDIGYNCEEMFDLAKKLCFGRFTITDNTVQLRPRIDPYWIQTAAYQLPSVEIEEKTYNLDELASTKLLKFRTDITDENTIDNYTGTSIEVRTDMISIGNQNLNNLKGFLEVDFGVALGTRKDELSAIEKLLKTAAGIIDKTTGVLGKGTRLSSKIKSRVGILKVTSNWNNIPKLLYLSGTTLPSNHRTLFSAPALYNKYYIDASFVLNDFKGQKAIYNQVTIPFGFEDYKLLATNSYFTFEGKEAKIINFEWIMGQDTAVVDFWVREVFTKNLKEIQIIQT